MDIDEKLRAYAAIHEDCSVNGNKLQDTIRKSKKIFMQAEAENDLSWLEFLYQQASYVQKRWWFAQGIVLLLLWLMLYLSDSSIYTKRYMGILAPIFVILMLPEFWKNRNSGSMEVEGTAYFSLQKIYAARMMLFGMVDICLLTIFLVVSACVVQIAVMDILIQFILPLNVTCCICFQTLGGKKNENVFTSLTCCFLWIAVWMSVVLRDNIYQNISTPVWMGAVFLSLIYLCYSVIRVWRCCEDYYEISSAVD
ncbi:hypothetical protein [Blautia wexlerae]|uniref:hypothetical protein n=1 Tax=Blautia wexlerae TaxID=418240 RepID=UPI00040DD055|nr:hypothetical protein [Blautia wexlerae]